MAVNTDEITAPPATEAPASEKQEKVVFTGDYVADEKGRCTLVVSFPAKAVESGFNPIKGLLALAENFHLRGYGDDNAPQCTVGVGRAKIKNDAGDTVDNPNAGQPTGNYSIVLHTDETLADAKKRGRTGKPEAAKKVEAQVSSLIKSVLSKPGALAEISALIAAQERGESSMSEVLAAIEAMKGGAEPTA